MSAIPTIKPAAISTDKPKEEAAKPTITPEQRTTNATAKLKLIEEIALKQHGTPGHNPFIWMNKSGFNNLKAAFAANPSDEKALNAIEQFDSSKIDTSVAVGHTVFQYDRE